MNRGLATNFTLTKGKFTLSSGEDKVDDNINMFFYFFGFFRVYLKDFAINVYFIFQRNAEIVRSRKNFLQLQILDAVNKYAKFVKLEAVEFPETFNSKMKSIGISIQYGYNLTALSKTKVATFIKTL